MDRVELELRNRTDIATILIFEAVLRGKSLTEEIRERFPPQRVRIFAITLDETVNDHLQPFVDTDEMFWLGFGCYHRVLPQWERLIAVCGGLHVAMTDVHGGFRRGAGPLIEWLLQRYLLRNHAYIMFAVSTLNDQLRRGKQVVAAGDITQALFKMATAPASAYEVNLAVCGAYHTMVYFAGPVRRKDVRAPDLADFSVQTIPPEVP